MTQYSTEIVHVGVGLLGNFDKNLANALQTALDKGSKEGKKLHSVQYIQARSDKHLTYLVVWESEGRATSSKPAKSKTTDTKPAKSKTAESKPAESKPAKSKTTDTKPAKSKTAESKTAKSKTADSKPAKSKTTKK